MPESEVLLGTLPRSDAPAGPSVSAVNPEEHDRRPSASGVPEERELTPASSSASSTIDEAASPAAPRRPSIWQLPFCAADTSWLHVSNTIVYFLAFCTNVLVNSGAVWRTVRAVDLQYGPVLTPAGWSYYIRDLTLFLWGLAVTCQSLAEHKGWKDGLVACIGHSWQIFWYSDTVAVLLHVVGPPTGLTLAPLFTLTALLAAAATLTRVAVLVPELQGELQAAGFGGVPPLAYLLYVYPTSLACGWLLVRHCHATALATALVTGSEQAALNVGCVSLVLATGLALLLLVRLRDVVFGLAFTWGCVAVWVAGFAAQEDYRADQLVAFFCALIMGMLTYCVAAGPQVRLAMGGWTTAVAPPPPPPPAPIQPPLPPPPSAAAAAVGPGGGGAGFRIGL